MELSREALHLTFPLAARCMVIGWHEAFGAVLFTVWCQSGPFSLLGLYFFLLKMDTSGNNSPNGDGNTVEQPTKRCKSSADICAGGGSHFSRSFTRTDDHVIFELSSEDSKLFHITKSQ